MKVLSIQTFAALSTLFLIVAAANSLPLPSWRRPVALQQQQQPLKEAYLPGLMKLFSKGETFACQGPDATSSLKEVANFLTSLVKEYRDEIFGHKYTQSPKVDICLGGWNDGAANKPSIFVDGMDKAQVKRLIRLIESKMKKAFDGINLRKSGTSGIVVTRTDGIKTPERKVSY